LIEKHQNPEEPPIELEESVESLVDPEETDKTPEPINE